MINQYIKSFIQRISINSSHFKTHISYRIFSTKTNNAAEGSLVRQIQENYENIANRDNCSAITTTSTKRHNLNLEKYTYDCNSKEGIAQILKGNLSSGVTASDPIKTIAPTSIPKSSLRPKIGNTSSYSSHTKVSRFTHIQISIGFNIVP